MAEHVEVVYRVEYDREAHELAFLNLQLRMRQLQWAIRRLMPPGPGRRDPFTSRRTTLAAR